MNFIKLATVTTLDQVVANIRANSGTLSASKSKVFKNQMVNIVHDSLMKVYSLYRPFVFHAYQTKETVMEEASIIDISAKEIADFRPGSLTLSDASHGPVEMVDEEDWAFRKRQEGTSVLNDPNRLFAHVANMLSTDNKLVIETERGTTVATPGVLSLTYNRSPRKTLSSDTDRKLDISERFIPLVTDLATLAVFKRIGKEAPGDIVGSVTAQVQQLMNEYKLAGIDMPQAS